MKGFIKESIISLFRRLGYDIIPSSRYMPRDIAGHLKALFEKLDISCVLDVGANTGQYRDFIRDQVGYKGLIISFEPVREAVKTLKEKAKTDAQWLIYHCALGAENATRTINVMRANDLSSFLDPDNSVIDLLSSHNVIDHTENVWMKTLDSMMDELRAERDIGRKLYLKMDTQGYDLEVIKGAEKSLSEILALQTELSCQSIYKNMPGYLEVLEALNKRGYQVSGMFPALQDTLLRVIEYDAVMINGALVKDENPGLMWTKEV
jgi:FkbM family methyltransferase